MRTWIRSSVAALSLIALFVPTLVFAHSTAKMPAIGVRVLSPKAGATITGNSIPVHVAFTHWKLSCAWAGKAPQPGIGHYHLLLDGALINMYCRDRSSVSLQNVSPGKHILTVVPAENSHMAIMSDARQIRFTYQPAHPLPPITAVGLGTPSIRIVSPKKGTRVHGWFHIKVKIRNFHPSCALYGKTNVAGYGHWHVNHDTLNGPMMGMGTMMGMGCRSAMRVSTVGLRPGKHTFIALLVDNQHAPLMPTKTSKVTLNVR